MSTKWSSVIVAGLFMTGLAGTATALQPTQGEVLSFHSEGYGQCPDLDWHLVVGANKHLSGLIAWDGMKNVARVSGSFDEGGKFHLALQPVDGSASPGNVDGQLPEYTGWLTASVTGAGCPHQQVQVQWQRYSAAGVP
jgi:hypothetical protein